MKIARQAWRFVIWSVAVDSFAVVAAALAASRGYSATLTVGLIVSFLATLFTLFCLYFFRDP